MPSTVAHSSQSSGSSYRISSPRDQIRRPWPPGSPSTRESQTPHERPPFASARAARAASATASIGIASGVARGWFRVGVGPTMISVRPPVSPLAPPMSTSLDNWRKCSSMIPKPQCAAAIRATISSPRPRPNREASSRSRQAWPSSSWRSRPGDSSRAEARPRRAGGSPLLSTEI